jgi:CHAD domain-containing protein
MGMNRHTEQEWQFAASELGPARDWLAAQPQDPTERRCAPQPTLNVQDTYYDSPDWMIFRAGFALRVRRSREADALDAVAGDAAGNAEITLKSLRPVSQNGGNDGLARRTEITEQVGQADLEQVLARGEGIGERIRQLVGSRPLTPLFHARTRRERQRLLEADSDLPLAEVDLDETSIETPSGQSRELRRVEVECIHADPGALGPWVEQLREAAQLQPVESSKFRAGLEAAGLTPTAAQATGNITISGSQSFADAQLATLRRYFEGVLEKESEVRAGSSAAVHEMRVAARHIDVLLRVFRGYGPVWAVASRGRVQGLIKALGAVRDCDVQLGFLDEKLAAQGPDERAALVPIRERLVARQQKARTRLLQSLDSPPVQTWMREWRQHLAASTPGSARAQRARAAVVARRLIREQARALRKRARRLDDQSPPDDYHGVRIRAKRLRYTIDAFASLYGEAAEDYVRALARLQTTLGEYNDSKIREQKFAEMVSQGPRLPASTSFLVGRLVERDAHAAERLRRDFTRAYRRIRRRRWRALATVMKREAQSAPGTLDSVKPG